MAALGQETVHESSNLATGQIEDGQANNPFLLHRKTDANVAESNGIARHFEKRPFYVTRDGEGKPVLELFG